MKVLTLIADSELMLMTFGQALIIECYRDIRIMHKGQKQ